jgi:hypothetical protein
VIASTMERVASPSSEVRSSVIRCGLIADVQFADRPNKVKETCIYSYHESLSRLRRAIQAFDAAEDVHVAISLGDLIEGTKEEQLARLPLVPDEGTVEGPTMADLRTVTAVLRESGVEWRHCVGNHECCLPRGALYRELNIADSVSDDGCLYYHWSVGRWRFIVLDTYDVSSIAWPEDNAHYREALVLQAERGLGTDPEVQCVPSQKASGACSNITYWNGGIGAEQLLWLRRTLDDVRVQRQAALVFGHTPLLAEAGDVAGRYHVYNGGEVGKVLAGGPAVAYICGHFHEGGYHQDVDGVHHVTIEGAVQAEVPQCHAILEVDADPWSGGAALRIDGVGVTSYKLELRRVAAGSRE